MKHEMLYCDISEMVDSYKRETLEIDR